MSALPGTPRPTQPRSPYYPHSDNPTAADAKVQQTNKRTGRKAKPISTPLKYDSDHASDNQARASPARSQASRPPHAPGSAGRKHNAPKPGYAQGVTVPVQIPQVDGTSSPRATPAHAHAINGTNGAATPMKAAAYAGPTFHASPAASALPLPKFFSKSVPAPNPTSGLQARLDADASDSNTPDTEERLRQAHAPPTPRDAREESPLDLFFNADRAERARNTSMSSHFATPKTPSSPAPPLTRAISDSPYAHSNPRATPQQWNGPTTPSGKEMFMMELDGAGENDESDDAPPSVPFKERLQLARWANHQQVGGAAPADEAWRQKQTLALKKLLGTQPQASSPLGQDRYNQRHETDPRDFADSPVRSNGTPTHGDKVSRPNVKSMENDLRRMLKLDP